MNGQPNPPTESSFNDAYWLFRRFEILLQFWIVPINSAKLNRPGADELSGTRTIATFLVVVFLLAVRGAAGTSVTFSAIAGTLGIFLSGLITYVSTRYWDRQTADDFLMAALTSTLVLTFLFVLFDHLISQGLILPEYFNDSFSISIIIAAVITTFILFLKSFGLSFTLLNWTAVRDALLLALIPIILITIIKILPDDLFKLLFDSLRGPPAK